MLNFVCPRFRHTKQRPPQKIMMSCCCYNRLQHRVHDEFTPLFSLARLAVPTSSRIELRVAVSQENAERMIKPIPIKRKCKTRQYSNW